MIAALVIARHDAHGEKPMKVSELAEAVRLLGAA